MLLRDAILPLSASPSYSWPPVQWKGWSPGIGCYSVKAVKSHCSHLARLPLASVDGCCRHLWILFNCLNACLLNLSNFITASFVSPLTLQLLGNVKTVLGIFISALIFGNAVTPAQAAGCGAAVGGVYVYQRWKGSRWLIITLLHL